MPGKIKEAFVIGVDFGTDSVRSVIVDALNGMEIASSVFAYLRWRDGLYCDAARNRFRQHPLDYTEGLEYTIKACLGQAGPAAAAAVCGISIDTTGSTPVAVNEQGVPLALMHGFEQDPNAMFVLWKDHTAVKEAAEINAYAAKQETDYLKYSGGIYSSEWYWAKLLHVLRVDEQVAKACYTWVEHCDWLTFLLCGGTRANAIKRSRCAAGHKALWAAEWGGYPPDSFFTGLDLRLSGFASRLPNQTNTAGEPAGLLCRAWAERLGLTTKVVVGTGAFDAHMGAVGGQIEPYYLSKVMGTSTCDILVAPAADLGGRAVRGICGQVDGSVIPGMIGLEAGQSAFGDTYAWFTSLLSWPLQFLENAETVRGRLLTELSGAAAELEMSGDAEMALDWLNGRRTPDADQNLKAAITGLSLGSDAPRIFRALAEGTCFGARSIVERFNSEGVPVKGLIGIGGVAKKSPYIMQLMADVLGMPIRINKSEQTCALGAAMFAATASGIYPDVQEAMQAMGAGFEQHYMPDPGKKDLYNTRYQKYLRLGHFIEEDRYE